ncbi:MAG: hypothetical protein KJ964_10540 [Verrucomicrobia bacterium]|nr:hypothetical protein [Verrucomicrobiota bacterium]MBU1735531.1 hypothetical protein [Verrucomicrobiota bacterium]MBU1857998.1 hypothetical protein [Verrucomicrobiota bacterium]
MITGLPPTAGTNLDLRCLRNIAKLYVDDVFWGKIEGETTEIVFNEIGKRMTIETSDNFQHMVIYAPPHGRFICMENLASCPNAPNLQDSRYSGMANMLVAKPGQTITGWIQYTIEALKSIPA